MNPSAQLSAMMFCSNRLVLSASPPMPSRTWDTLPGL
jgi:hypothetical protein